MTLRLRKKLRITVLNLDASRLRHTPSNAIAVIAVVTLSCLAWFSGEAVGQVAARQATWSPTANAASAPGQNTPADVRPNRRLAWGAKPSETRRASGFAEIDRIRTHATHNVGPVSQSNEPAPFPVVRANGAAREQQKIQVAKMHAASFARRRAIRTVAAEEELQDLRHVAGRISNDAFGDSLTSSPSNPGGGSSAFGSGPFGSYGDHEQSGLQANPHLDPFGDNTPAPKATRQPFAPMTQPTQSAATPMISLTPSPVVEPIPPSNFDLEAFPSVKPLPDFKPDVASETEEPADLPEIDLPTLPEPLRPIPPPATTNQPKAAQPAVAEPAVAEPAFTMPAPAKPAPIDFSQPTPAMTPSLPEFQPPPIRQTIEAPAQESLVAPIAKPQVEHQIQQPLPGIERTFAAPAEQIEQPVPVKPTRTPTTTLTQLGDIRADDLPPLFDTDQPPPAAYDQGNPFAKEDASEVPEFPEYEKDIPSTAPETKEPGDDGLPEIKEPPRPGDDDGEADDDDDDLLNFPGDDDKPEDGDDEGEDEDEEDEEDGDDDEDEDEAARCGRIYNKRNCCALDADCQKTMQRLREATIEDVSISITPPLVPLAEDETEVEEQRERLLKSPVRNWTTRNGAVVATGQLVDFRDESIIVQSTEGYRVPIPYYQLGHDDLCFLTAWWRLPGECLLAGDNRATRSFQPMTFTWKASAICHKPLYFEEVQLERYGHSAGPILQPLLSGAHFISNIQLLPYNMGVYAPNECRYTLGHYRPGSCAPWLIPAFST